MLLVVAFGDRDIDRAELGRNEAQALAFDPADDLAGQAALDRVRLADDEGAIHRAADPTRA